MTARYVRVETDNDVTVTTITMANLASLTAAHADGGWEEVDATNCPGLYRFDLPDGVFATGAWSAVVYIMITSSAASAAPMEFILQIAPGATGGLPIIGTGANNFKSNASAEVSADVTKLLGTAWLTPGTAGTPDVNVKLISDDATAANNAEAFFDGTGYAGTNNIIPVVTILNGLANNVITASSIASDAITAAKIANGAIDAATFAAGAITATVIADGAIDAATFAAGAIDATAIANGAIDAATFAAGAIDAAAIADGAIDAATFAAGAINAAAIASDAITDAKVASDVTIASVTGAVGSVTGLTVATISDGVWDEAIAGHVAAGSTGEALGAAGAAGDPWTTAVPGAYGAGTAGSRIGRIPDIAAGGAGGLFIAGTNAATVVTTSFTSTFTGNLTGSVASVTGAVGSVTGAVGSVTGLTAANLDATISSRMATYTQPTGFLSATFPAGTIANTTNITAGTLTTVTTATNLTTNNDKTGYTLSATGSAAMTESYRANAATGTLPQLLYEIVAHLGESSIASTTKTINKLDHVTGAETFTLDSATTPTSITRST